jgi:hypothetical protein
MKSTVIKIIETLVPEFRQHFDIPEEEISKSFDEFLRSLPPPVPSLFLLLLRAFNYYCFLFHLKTFENLSLPQRTKILKNWGRSKLYVKRMILSTMKTFLLLVFYSQEKAEKKLGFERKCVSG